MLCSHLAIYTLDSSGGARSVMSCPQQQYSSVGSLYKQYVQTVIPPKSRGTSSNDLRKLFISMQFRHFYLLYVSYLFLPLLLCQFYNIPRKLKYRVRVQLLILYRKQIMRLCFKRKIRTHLDLLSIPQSEGEKCQNV